MAKKKKKEHWSNKWMQVNDDTMPPIGALVITVDTEECPAEDTKGNINQFTDGDWYHISKNGRPRWWKFLTPEEFTYYQDLAIEVFLDNLKLKLWENF